VTPQALPNARQQSIASPEIFGAQGDAIAQTGKSLQIAGAEGVALAGKMLERENVDQVFRAETVFGDDLIKFETEQRSKKGAAALADGGVTQLTQKFFDDNVRKRSETLGNDAQRRTFGQITEKMRLQTLRTVSTHEANEARVSVTESAKASIVGSVNRAAANANDWTVAEAEAKNIRTHIAALAKVNGYDQAQTDAAVGEHLTRLHKEMIGQLVKSNPAAVKTYYEKYESEIDGSQRAEIGAYATKATATSIGDGAADAVWQAQRPKNGTEPVALSTMEERLRTELKGNDEAIKVGIAGLRERAAAYKDQRKEESNALEASVNGLILQGATMGALRKSPEFLKLSTQAPEEARKIMTFLEGQAAARESRAAAAESRAYTRDARRDLKLHRDTLDTTLRLSDPNELMTLTRNEIINKLPELGSQNTQALLQRWEAFTKNGAALSEAKIDDQQFKAFAQRAGVDVTPKSGDDDGKERLIDLRDRVERVIGAEQQAKKRLLTRDEKDVLLQRQIDNEVMQRSPLWFDKAVPAIALPRDAQGAAYVTVNGRDVKLSSIPAAERTKITQKLQARGLPVTEKLIAETWLSAQPPSAQRGNFSNGR
jgi:hypothetical protein